MIVILIILIYMIMILLYMITSKSIPVKVVGIPFICINVLFLIALIHIQEFKYYYQILSNYIKRGFAEFKNLLNNLLNKLSDLNTEYSILMYSELISRVLLNGLIEKNLKHYKIKLKASPSKMIRTFRSQLEVEKKEFKNARFLILKRAENLSKQVKSD